MAHRKRSQRQEQLEPHHHGRRAGRCKASRMGHPIGAGLEGRWKPGSIESSQRREGEERHCSTTSGAWGYFDIMHFTDGKKRRVEPDNVRVVCHAMNAAMGDWGEGPVFTMFINWAKTGNAIVPPLAAEFIQAYMSIEV